MSTPVTKPEEKADNHYFDCPECGEKIGFGLNEHTKEAFRKLNLMLSPLPVPSKEEKKEELLPILEALHSYGRIHTVRGVIYPEGSHEEILDRLERYLNTEYTIIKSGTGNYRVKKPN